MTSFEARERQRSQDLFTATTARQMGERMAADARAIGDAARTARLNMLEQTFHDMQRQQPDLWGPGFDSAEAARRCLPVVEGLVTE